MKTRFTRHYDAQECQNTFADNLTVMPYDSADEELAMLSKALGHPMRVQIVRLLIGRGKCFCGELCEEIPLAQSTVSQHLKSLKQVGLIVGEADGLRVCYCINLAQLERLKLLVDAL